MYMDNFLSNFRDFKNVIRSFKILGGHKSPVSSVAFPLTAHALLASGSWDGTVRIWDIFSSNSSKEIIELHSDGIE